MPAASGRRRLERIPDHPGPANRIPLNLTVPMDLFQRADWRMV